MFCLSFRFRMSGCPLWLKRPVRGVLLDITGVLYDCGEGGGTAIDGSIEAVSRLEKAGIHVRFVTNETQCTRKDIEAKMNRLGYSMKVQHIFPPAPALVAVLKEQNLRPHLLVHPAVLPEFSEIDKTNPNCVVLGDAASHFSYENLNSAFRMLMAMEKPRLFSLGLGKYYKEDGGLTLDVGPYAMALKYACDVNPEVMGKPLKEYFLTAVKDMGISPEEAVMVGDDIESDVGGAQNASIRGVQVRTGKFQPSWENHPSVKPDAIVDNLKEAVDQILKYRS